MVLGVPILKHFRVILIMKLSKIKNGRVVSLENVRSLSYMILREAQ